MTRIHWAHKESTSIGLAGQQFDREEDGTFDIPEELVPHAKKHGAKVAPTPPAPLWPDKPVPQWGNDVLRAKAAELKLDVDGLDRPALIQAVSAAMNPKGQQ